MNSILPILFLLSVWSVEVKAQVVTVKREFLTLPLDPQKAVKQDMMGNNTCVPCSVMNALQFGQPIGKRRIQNLSGETIEAKAKSFLNKYAKKPSTIRKGQLRYEQNGEQGVHFFDVAAIYREGGAPKNVKVLQLNQLPGEGGRKQVHRVHSQLLKSMQRNVPVIISAVSIKADRASEDKEILWNVIDGHAMVLTSLPAGLQPEDDGFPVTFFDSASGKLLDGYIGVERARKFKAPVQLEGPGDRSEWLGDYPFLKIHCSGLHLDQGAVAWHRRTFVILKFACGLFD